MLWPLNKIFTMKNAKKNDLSLHSSKSVLMGYLISYLQYLFKMAQKSSTRLHSTIWFDCCLQSMICPIRKHTHT